MAKKDKGGDDERVELSTNADGKRNYRDLLCAYRKSSGVGPTALLARRKDKPEGLKAALVVSWLSERIKTARLDYLEYVLGLWRAELTDPFVPISKSIREILAAEKKRTAIGTIALLKRKAAGRPPRLNAAQVDAWLDGRTRAVRRSHLEYVLQSWRSLPAWNAPEKTQLPQASYVRRSPVPRSALEKLTPEIVRQLNAEYLRTGIGPIALLRSNATCPTGLNAKKIYRWLTGNTQSAPVEHIEFVLERWRKLPTPATPTTSPKDHGFVDGELPSKDVAAANMRKSYQPVSEADIACIRAHRQRTGISFSRLLTFEKNKPVYLSDNMIQNWLSERGCTADPAHIAFVLQCYKKISDKK